MTESPRMIQAAPAGTVLAGRYRLLERIAVGGMGEVWHAADEVLGRDVAVKLLKPEYSDDATFRARFRAEARAAAPLTSPGIAQVYDYGEDDPGGGAPTAYLVMELVPGEPLSTVLRREGVLGPRRTVDLVAQAAAALQVAHAAGVVHRDVKPGNLLLADDGAVRITDFGIARAADAVPLTQTGTLMGTAHYLAPEQAAGHGASPASDIYALGVVAYECLTGRRPFDGLTPVAVALAHLHEPLPPLPPTVPAEVRALVERCLAKDPADRPASAEELAARASAVRDQLPEGPAGTAALATLDVQPPEEVSAAAPAKAHSDLPTAALPLPSALPVAAPAPSPALDAAPTGEVPPGDRPPSRRTLGYVTAALLVLALAALAGWQLTRDDDVAPPATAQPAGPRTVLVDEAALVGRPYTEVRRLLTGLGLQVRRRDVALGGPAGTVAAVSPDGALRPGAVVTVDVVTVPPTQPGVEELPPTDDAKQDEQQEDDKAKDEEKKDGQRKNEEKKDDRKDDENKDDGKEDKDDKDKDDKDDKDAQDDGAGKPAGAREGSR